MSIRGRRLLLTMMLTLLLTALPALWQVGRLVQERQRSIQDDSALLQVTAQRRAAPTTSQTASRAPRRGSTAWAVRAA